MDSITSDSFQVTEHVIEAQHIREYAWATAADRSQEQALKLHIKQYTPREGPPLSGDAVTIIGAHANGFPKELYEPLWQEINQRASRQGFCIRGIWIADVAHQGQSGVLNETSLGNDPSWYDHSRDLLHMVNHFRRQMPRPIVGIGHSFGGTQLVNLALMHPRLFVSLVLLDPVIDLGSTVSSGQGQPSAKRLGVANASTYRRDVWPSKEAAAEAFAKSSFYQKWDPRILELWIEYGLRPLPTALYPEQHREVKQRPVTLATTKHQEVWTFLRPNYSGYGVGGLSTVNRLTHPDVDPSSLMLCPFYRPESGATHLKLPALRPSVFYIMGELSNLAPADKRRDKVKLSGIGPGGSGGLAEGQVRDITLPGVGHLVPMEAVIPTAEHTAQWLGEVIAQWKKNEVVLKDLRGSRNKDQDLMVDEQWVKHIGDPPKARQGSKAPKL